MLCRVKYWTCVGITDHQRRPIARASGEPESGRTRASTPAGRSSSRQRRSAAPGSIRCSITSAMTSAPKLAGSSSASSKPVC